MIGYSIIYYALVFVVPYCIIQAQGEPLRFSIWLKAPQKKRSADFSTDLGKSGGNSRLGMG